MVAVVSSVALIGYEGVLVSVETDARSGLPGMQIVGMGNKAIDEARERVRSAIRNSSLDFPARKYTVNLAPAELPKDGTHLDIPIALSILVSSGQLRPHELKGCIFAGELALDGSLRPVRGAIMIAETAHRLGYKRVFLPTSNLAQAQLVHGIETVGIDTLLQLFQVLKGIAPTPSAPQTPLLTTPSAPVTFDDIYGHEQAKRALLIAAAGHHNLLLSGPPGTGKTLLARALQSILPALSPDETREATLLNSLAAGETGTIITTPPFRSPHHTTTLTALIGGGQRPRPGEVSLAHKGVLFLDELPEFSRATLEALRQPLEDKVVHLSRVYGRLTYPADFILVATMNPCPCGYASDSVTLCTCTPATIAAYTKRLSGPLLDRFDLRLTISRIDIEQLTSSKSMHSQQQRKVLRLVYDARNRQNDRYKRSSIYNAHASPKMIDTSFAIEPAARKLATIASQRLNLSARSFYRMLRVARTIADLESSQTVTESHIAEALQFR